MKTRTSLPNGIVNPRNSAPIVTGCFAIFVRSSRPTTIFHLTGNPVSLCHFVLYFNNLSLNGVTLKLLSSSQGSKLFSKLKELISHLFNRSPRRLSIENFFSLSRLISENFVSIPHIHWLTSHGTCLLIVDIVNIF